ncbi:hypothetical protein [Rhodoplanes serenus]|uniref:hypothetical protein n=1 Tax=Rhodoplanes serenus TaxID=200615 RepID=UPI000DAE20F1|nr:hypothetical protein [Rhodoplanes serenus]RAI30578.1 hypothetical protein CH340_21180 [Rhodoplanes serenus]
MGETKHTEGPWLCGEILAFGHHRLVISADGAKIACVYGPSSAANASLIAAAPETAAERDRLREVNAELVEALRFYSDEWERDVFGDVGDPDRFFAVVSPTNSLREDKGRRASAALAKAEGR